MNDVCTSKILNIRMVFGICAFLAYNGIFNYLLKNNICEKINASISRDAVRRARPQYTKDIYMDYDEILKLIFIDSKVKIVDNQEYPEIFIGNICGVLNIEIRAIFNIKYNLFCDVAPDMFDTLPEKYVTINQKAIGMEFKTFHAIKEGFFKLLNKLNITVILIGERENIQYDEYVFLTNFSIYNDCKTNLQNYIDCTYKDQNDNSNLTSFRRNCAIYNKSKLNIFFGSGGVMYVLLYTSNKILGYAHDTPWNNVYTYGIHEYDTSEIIIANNSELFVNSLDKFVLQINATINSD